MSQGKIKRRIRIFNTSGIISLVMLPLLCYWFVNKNFSIQHSHYLEIVMPDPPTTDHRKMRYSISSLPKRKYYSVNLTSNIIEDEAKLKTAQLQLRSIMQRNDSIHGLHFVFGDKTKYWELVRIIDICNIEGVNTYALYKNDFWALKMSQAEIVDREAKIRKYYPLLPY